MVISLSLSGLNAAENVKPLSTELSAFINVRDFTAHNDEAYFTAQDVSEQRSLMVKSQRINNQWADFERVPFSGQYRDIEPFFSPDGLRLYFASNRPTTGNKASNNYDIWYVKRDDYNQPWSEPMNVGPPVNSEHNEFYPAISENNNLYFTSDKEAKTRKDDIYISLWQDHQYQKPVPLSDHINSSGYEFNAYIAADESFLIYSVYGAEDGLGGGDLYISYRALDGTFTPRVNLGASINSDKLDFCPFYDAKNERLVFTSRREAIGDHAFKDVPSFLNATHQYKNGLSRLYQVPLTIHPKQHPANEPIK